MNTHTHATIIRSAREQYRAFFARMAGAHWHLYGIPGTGSVSLLREGAPGSEGLPVLVSNVDGMNERVFAGCVLEVLKSLDANGKVPHPRPAAELAQEVILRIRLERILTIAVRAIDACPRSEEATWGQIIDIARGESK